MRDQGDFKSGVKHFAYNGGKTSKTKATDDEWDHLAGTKPIKGNQAVVWSETKELDELQDIWSIQKNVSLSRAPLKPQGDMVHAAPTGTGFYSRHGQHGSRNLIEGTRYSPSMNAPGQQRNRLSTNPQRSGYSYSQSETNTGTTTLPLLSPTAGVSQYQSQSRYVATTQSTSNSRHHQGGGVMSPRTQIGVQKSSQHTASSQHLSGNNKTSRTGNHWPN